VVDTKDVLDRTTGGGDEWERGKVIGRLTGVQSES